MGAVVTAHAGALERLDGGPDHKGSWRLVAPQLSGRSFLGICAFPFGEMLGCGPRVVLLVGPGVLSPGLERLGVVSLRIVDYSVRHGVTLPSAVEDIAPRSSPAPASPCLV